MSVSMAEIEAVVTADTGQFDSAITASGQKVDDLGSKGTTSGANFGAASAVMAAGAVGIGAGIAGAVSAAGDFQSSMNEIGAVTGATAEQMTGLSDVALQVGMDTSFSAQQGAQAIAELGKAGIPISDIMNGAAMATAQLAAAGGVDMPRAAEVMSNAMNSFGLSGGQAADVADTLAAASNASASDVNSLAMGLSQVAPSARGLGLSLEETVAQLALFSNYGMQGSDAGTSFKTMIASLTPSTKAAREEFVELGLTTADTANAFFDAQGNFVGMEQATNLLYEALAPLTNEQRLVAEETLFGSDASRAAEITFQAQKAAVEGTASGYSDLLGAVEPAGQATDVANAKMAGMNGALEALRGSVETAQIAFGTAFLPVVEQVADGLTTLVNMFLALDPQMQSTISVVAAGAAGFLAVGSAIGFIIGPLGAVVGAAAPVAAGIAAISAPLLLVVAGIAALKLAYDTNFLGFADGVNAAIPIITGAITNLITTIQSLARYFIEVAQGGDTMNDWLTHLPTSIQGVATAIGTGITTIQAFSSAFQVAIASGMNPFAAAINALAGTLSILGFTELAGTVSLFAAAMQTAGTNLVTLVGNLTAAFQTGGLEAAVGVLSSAFTTAWSNIQLAISSIDWAAVSATILTAIQGISDSLLTAFNSIDWATVGNTLLAGVTSAIGALAQLSTMLLTKGADLVAGLVQGIGDHLPDVATKLGEIATGAAAVLPDALTLLLQKGVDLVAGLVQGIGDHLPDIATKLGEIATNVALILPDALTLLLQKGTDLIAGLVQGIGDHLPDVTTKLGEVATDVGNALPDALTLLLAKGGDLIAGLLQGITDKWPDIESWFTALGPLIDGFLADFGTLLLAHGSELIGGLFQGITDKWPEVDTWLAGLGQDAADTVGELGETLLAAGTALLAGLKSGIDAKWPEIDTWLAALPQDAIDTVGDLVATLTPAGTALLTGLQTGITDFWTGTVQPWLLSMGQLAIDAVGDLGETLKTAGAALLDGLRLGALDVWNNVLGPWIQSIPTLATGAVGDLSTALSGAGTALIQGLWDGATAKWTEFTDWLTTLDPTQYLPDINFGGGGDAAGDARNAVPNPEGKAGGGPVASGLSYWVGERGPEIFTPSRSGSITPNGAAMSMAGGGGGLSLTIQTLNLPGVQDAEAFVDAMRDLMQQSGVATGRGVS